MMTSLMPSPQMIALVQASTSAADHAASRWAGAVADNLDRRKVMLAAQAFMLLVSALLAISAWAGLLTPWLLLVFTFLIGCGTAFNGPAWQASVGDMVPREDAARRGRAQQRWASTSRAASARRSAASSSPRPDAAAAFPARQRDQLCRPDRRARALAARSAGIARCRASGSDRDGGGHPLCRDVAGRSASYLFRALVFGFAASAVPALMPLVARDLVERRPADLRPSARRLRPRRGRRRAFSGRCVSAFRPNDRSCGWRRPR
jgi:hypothetical protein